MYINQFTFRVGLVYLGFSSYLNCLVLLRFPLSNLPDHQKQNWTAERLVCPVGAHPMCLHVLHNRHAHAHDYTTFSQFCTFANVPGERRLSSACLTRCWSYPDSQNYFFLRTFLTPCTSIPSMAISLIRCSFVYSHAPWRDRWSRIKRTSETSQSGSGLTGCFYLMTRSVATQNDKRTVTSPLPPTFDSYSESNTWSLK